MQSQFQGLELQAFRLKSAFRAVYSFLELKVGAGADYSNIALRHLQEVEIYANMRVKSLNPYF